MIIITTIIFLAIIFAILAYQDKKGEKMNWTKLLYVLIIILLYIPMVFLGANVFFPEYTGSNRYYNHMESCYKPVATPIPDMNNTERQAYEEEAERCRKDSQERQQQWELEKNAYEGNKYVVVTIFNLIILLIALFVPLLQDSVVMGLFLGSLASTFGATIRYFDTNSKVGFIVVVVTFFTMLYFINKKKDKFMDWKTDEKPKRKKR